MADYKKPQKGSASVQIQCTVISSRQNPFTLIRKQMKTTGMDAAREVIKEEGDALAAKLQLNLLQQSLPMKDLTESYARWKERKALDPRILIATGEYVNSIAARRKAGGDIVDVSVPDETHEPSGLSLKELGRIHEYGSKRYEIDGKGIPPRPHWRPTIRWWKKKRMAATEAEIDRYVAERVFKKLSEQIGTQRHIVKPNRRK